MMMYDDKYDDDYDDDYDNLDVLLTRHFNSILHLLCHVIFIYFILLFNDFGYYFNKRLLLLKPATYLSCNYHHVQSVLLLAHAVSTV